MKQYALLALMMMLIASCGGSRRPVAPYIENTSRTYDYPGASEPAVRFVFHPDHFTKLTDYITYKHTQYGCVGDAIHSFYVNGDDYTGSPNAFPTSSTPDDFSPTNKPGFVRNVSLDMTQTYYAETVSGTLQTDACSYRGIANRSEPNPCADFDVLPLAAPAPTIAPTPTPVPTPMASATPSATPYYGLNFYRVRDEWCSGQGPIISPNQDTTKARVGGVNIDIDRSQLGASEDLLMVMTYQALNENASWPSVQYSHDATSIEVNLIGTALGLDLLIGAHQPRPWGDYGNTQMPVYMKTIAHFQDPYASLRTEQVIIPLSQNALVDRIRIERIRGSFHLYQLDLYRLGNREN